MIVVKLKENIINYELKENKIRSNMPEERQHYLSILSTENVTKSLSYLTGV